MKGCIITSTNRSGSCNTTTVMVHCRNALVIANSLGMDLIEGEADAWKLSANKYDHIICSYSSYYMPWKAYFKAVMRSKAQLWWMVNDHDIEDNILLRHVLHATDGKRRYNVISNNTRSGYRQWILRKWIFKNRLRLDECIADWHTVNLNALTYEDRTRERKYRIELFNPQVIYWGSWRKWRLDYFRKYADRRILFSTSRKNIVKLEQHDCRYSWAAPIHWGNGCLLHWAHATIYIEDLHTHTNYAYPANRFYEAISYGVNVYFDKSCTNTAERIGNAEYVKDKNELLLRGHARTQDQTQWRRNAVRNRTKALNDLSCLLN